MLLHPLSVARKVATSQYSSAAFRRRRWIIHSRFFSDRDRSIRSRAIGLTRRANKLAEKRRKNGTDHRSTVLLARNRRKKSSEGRRSEEEVYTATLSSVLSRLDAGSYLDGCPPACLPACLLACLLARLRVSRLLEKPDSSCAKLCFPSRVYVPTHVGAQCWMERCTCTSRLTALLLACAPRCSSRSGLGIDDASLGRLGDGSAVRDSVLLEEKANEGSGEGAARMVLKGPRCHRP